MDRSRARPFTHGVAIAFASSHARIGLNRRALAALKLTCSARSTESAAAAARFSRGLAIVRISALCTEFAASSLLPIVAAVVARHFEIDCLALISVGLIEMNERQLNRTDTPTPTNRHKPTPQENE